MQLRSNPSSSFSHQTLLEGQIQLSVAHLPSSLTLLHIEDDEMDSNWNYNLDLLPPSLTNLKLEQCHRFNKPLDNLPPALTSLNLGSCRDFNHPLYHLPAPLKELYVSVLFNNPVDNLPSTLLTLDLGSSFDQPVDHLSSTL